MIGKFSLPEITSDNNTATQTMIMRKTEQIMKIELKKKTLASGFWMFTSQSKLYIEGSSPPPHSSTRWELFGLRFLGIYEMRKITEHHYMESILSKLSVGLNNSLREPDSQSIQNSGPMWKIFSWEKLPIIKSRNDNRYLRRSECRKSVVTRSISVINHINHSGSTLWYTTPQSKT